MQTACVTYRLTLLCIGFINQKMKCMILSENEQINFKTSTKNCDDKDNWGKIYSWKYTIKENINPSNLFFSIQTWRETQVWEKQDIQKLSRTISPFEVFASFGGLKCWIFFLTNLHHHLKGRSENFWKSTTSNNFYIFFHQHLARLNSVIVMLINSTLSLFGSFSSWSVPFKSLHK